MFLVRFAIFEHLVALFTEFAKNGDLRGIEPEVAARRVLYLSEGILLVRATVDEPHTVAAETEAMMRSFAAANMTVEHPGPSADP